MKIGTMIVAALALCGIFTQCTTNLDIRKLSDETEFVAPELLGPEQINISAEDVVQEAVISFSWSKADFGQPTEVVYGIKASYGGKSTEFFGNITAVKYEVSAAELQQKLNDLGVPAGTQVSVDMSVSATIGSDFGTISSAIVPVKVLLEE